MTDQRVAYALGLRPGTVRTHVENLRRKLGVRTRAQAVAGAIATGLVEG
jgi:DNA-binding CsgD family transcriptional regulator